jgi:signal transduction histidine kinase
MAHLFRFQGLSLRVFLIVPFLLEVFLAVGLTGWFSLRNGEKAVNELAKQLQGEVSDRIQQHLDNYLEKPVEINAFNAESLRLNVLSVDDPQGLARRFWQQIKVYGAVQYIYFGNEQGGYIGAGREQDGLTLEMTANFQPGSFQIWKTNRQGQRTEFLKSEPDYDTRQRAWYQDAIQRGQPDWHEVYLFVDGKLGLSATHPIFDDAGRPLGVLGVDYMLNGISEFLRSVPGSSHGTTFIMERPSGLLIGSSTPEQPLIEAQTPEDEAQRLGARQSSQPSIQQTAIELAQQVGNLSTLDEPLRFTYFLAGERQFVQVVPISVGDNLDWLIVVVMPESDFMAQINANTRNTILLCGIALAIAAVLGILTARAIVAPINQLNLAAQRLAEGDFSPTVPSHYSTHEIRTLATSFNQMAKQLRIAFLNLEKRVAERTNELATAKEIAEEASQAKSEFFARMTHDFCTPLNGILGYAQLLQQDVTLSPQQRHTLQTIHDYGVTLLGLVHNTLDLAQITAHQLDLEPCATNLASFLSEISALLRMHTAQKGLDCVAYWPATLPFAIFVDARRLHQVLVNVMSSAVQGVNSGTLHFAVTEVPGPDGRDWRHRAEQAQDPGHPPRITLRFHLDDRGIDGEPQSSQTLVLPAEAISDRLPDPLTNDLGLTISRQLLILMDSQLQITNTTEHRHQFHFELTVPVVMK